MSPRTKQQFEEIREVSQEKIMEAAMELFSKKGYQATSINDIVKKAGVSKGLLYHYFDSKEALLRDMVDHFLSQGEELMERIMDPDPQTLLRNMINVLFEDMRTRFDLYSLIINITVQIHELDFVYQLAVNKYKAYIELFTDLFRQLDYQNPKGEALILTALFDGIGVQYFTMKGEYPLDEMKETLLTKYCS
jgi:AcrR family transcriptional regulator